MSDNLTFEKVWLMFQETNKQFKEMSIETDKQLKEMSAETDRKFQEMRDEFQVISKETDRKFQEMREEFQVISKETDRKFQEMREEFQVMSKDTNKKFRRLESLFTGHWGKLVESLVEGDLVHLLNIRGIPVNQVYQRLVKKVNDIPVCEIDLIAQNGKEVVFVEVKTTLKVKDIDHFLDTLKQVKTIFPAYSGNTIYGAVAYIKEEETASSYAMKNGLFVIRATGKSASITNPEEFQPTVY